MQLGTTNTIAGWSITTTKIEDSTQKVQIDAGNSRFLIQDASGNEMVRMGLLNATQYGISGSNAAGELLFKLGEAGNEIAGWTIDPDYIGKASIRIDAANTKIVVGNSGIDSSGTTTRAVMGLFDAGYGFKIWDGTNTYVRLHEDNDNLIAGWALKPTMIAKGSVSMSYADEAFIVNNGTTAHRVIMGKLATKFGTSAGAYGFILGDGLGQLAANTLVELSNERNIIAG